MGELTERIERLEQRQGELGSELEMQDKKLKELNGDVKKLRGIVIGLRGEIEKSVDMLKRSQ